MCTLQQARRLGCAHSFDQAQQQHLALARVADALKAEAREESAHARRMARWASALEAAFAGVGAPLVLASSGIEIGSIAVGLVAAALGAALLLYGKRLRLYA